MSSALKAGLSYFAIVFAAGFVFGTIRALALAPHLGGTLAVAAELPVMLAVSWIACSWIMARHSVPQKIGARLLMGGVAFALLISAEIILGVVGFGRTVYEFFGAYRTAEGALGLLAQVAFGTFPLIQLRRGDPR